MTLYKISNKSKIFLFSTLCLCITPNLIVGMEQAKEGSGSSITPQGVIQHARNLFILSSDNRYKEALQGALRSDPAQSSGITLTVEQKEIYYFHRLAAIGMAYKGAGDQTKGITPNKAIQYYGKSIEFVEKYLNAFDPFVSQNENMRNTPLNHCTFMYQIAGTAYFELFELKVRKKLENDDQIYFDGFAKSEYYTKRSLDLSGRNFSTEQLADQNFRLFNIYVALCDYAPLEKKQSFLKKAKDAHLTIQGYYDRQPTKEISEFFHASKNSLQLWEKKQEVNLPHHNKSSRKQSKKVQEYTNKKFNEAVIKLHEKNEENDSITKFHDLNGLILTKNEHFNALVKTEKYSEAICKIKDIEETINKQLTQDQSSAELQDIYETYCNIFNPKDFQNNMLNIISIFMRLGEMQDALNHVLALSHLEQKKIGNITPLTRYLQAAIKSINGDYEEWKSIEEELISLHTKSQEKKEIEKQKEHEKHVSKIKESQQLTLQSKTEANNTTTTTTKQNEKTTHKNLTPLQGAINSLSGHERAFESPVPSPEQEKQEKIRRHEEAQMQREAQQISSNNTTTTTTTTTSLRAEERDIRATPSSASPADVHGLDIPLIKDLYDLSTTAKFVDEQIENNTWRFTREDFIIYLENLGCILKEGGRHPKISLPRAITVYHEGKILTIINDLGGALTLPRWDGSEGNGQVPNYLRGQILTAREKLVLWKIKVNNTTAR